ncbi:mitochondrial import receptor subunit TOM70 isoform X1 [Lethenteron reissneri]|uniref:mitochondrial import receptor subunit TOM70 isoform X1 n=1 Tax=Lethenteron reissneri TaxID=7753 RepID=UPI002AB62882|nr:mitochondrial import receptor subunit TOM70 isoform X1 [Lethenteron reissneri]
MAASMPVLDVAVPAGPAVSLVPAPHPPNPVPLAASGPGHAWNWRAALAVGAPLLVVGAAAYLVWRRRALGKRREPEGSASPPGPPSLPSGKGGGEAKESESEAGKSGDEQTPLEKAHAAKNRGNRLFKAGRFADAVQCYSQAITLGVGATKEELATFHQNRAAALQQMGDWDAVLSDCDRALELHPRYVKALHRRARVHEQAGRHALCLEDITAVCILEGFQNQQSMLIADRVLKELGRERARERYKDREPVFPSAQFVQSYFNSFNEDPTLISETDGTNPIQDGAPSSAYERACERVRAGDYTCVIALCDEELGDGSGEGPWGPRAQLLRATFQLLSGSAVAAQVDLDQLIDSENVPVKVRVNALIKRGSMHMQSQDVARSVQDFARALELDPSNADVHHHRGQLHILLDRVDEAMSDFEECVRLKQDFPLARAQRCFAQYRAALSHSSPSEIQASMKAFDKLIRDCPRCAEAYALYAQALTDQQMFDRADEMYDSCIQLEPNNATTYVHKGLLQLQWRQDLDAGVRLISRAIQIDPKCDFAYETLGTIEVQRGNLTRAVQLFEEAVTLSKSEMEMAHLLSLCHAAQAQLAVATKYGLVPSNV